MRHNPIFLLVFILIALIQIGSDSSAVVIKSTPSIFTTYYGGGTSGEFCSIVSQCGSSQVCTFDNLSISFINTTKIESDNYAASDGSLGITDSVSYWLCIDAMCVMKCQAIIKNGLITGCT
jgi:hypothetical protein